MNPILYEKDTTSFNTNGLGVISDGVYCYVTEQINGKYEIELQYPVSGDMFSRFAINRIIYAPHDAYNTWQPFRISRITKSLPGYVTVYGEHKSYELNGQICMPNMDYSETPGSVSTLMTYLTTQSANAASALGGQQYSFSTDISATDNWVIKTPMSIREVMTYAAQMFNGEWEYNGVNCILRAHRGQDRGVKVKYAYNLKDYIGNSTDDSYTHIMPFWTDGTNYVYTNPQYILLSTTTSNMQRRVKPVDLSGEFEEAPEQSDLLNAAYKTDEYLHPKTIEINETISFVPLSQTVEYQYLVDSDHVEIGDTVGIKIPLFDVDSSARCTVLQFDVYKGRNRKTTVGTPAKTLAASIRTATPISNPHTNVIVSVTEPTDNIKQGDYWIKVDNMTDLNAISVGRLESGNWILLCKFSQGGSVTLPKVTASPTRPTAVIDGDCLAMVSGTTLTALKRLISGEWTNVPFDYGTNPGTLHTEGEYYGWFNNGVLVAIYVYENSTIKQVAPGANSLYINDVPENEASVGDYWLNIDSLTNRNLYEVQRLEQGENTISWVTLYNVAVPAVYVQATEPSGAGVKPNAWWIQTGGQSFYDKTIVAVKQYEANYGWVTRCTPGSGSGDLTINIDYAIVVDKGNVI